MKAKKLHCALRQMEPDSISQATDMLRTLAYPMCLRIVDALNTAGELPVCEITDYLGIVQSATSQHLNHMQRIELLKAERRGKAVW